MSQTIRSKKIPKLKVYNKNPGSVSTGTNTVVELDGVKVLASFLKIEFKPTRVAKVYLEMYADVEMEDIGLDVNNEDAGEQGATIVTNPLPKP